MIKDEGSCHWWPLVSGRSLLNLDGQEKKRHLAAQLFHWCCSVTTEQSVVVLDVELGECDQFSFNSNDVLLTAVTHPWATLWHLPSSLLYVLTSALSTFARKLHCPGALGNCPFFKWNLHLKIYVWVTKTLGTAITKTWPVLSSGIFSKSVSWILCFIIEGTLLMSCLAQSHNVCRATTHYLLPILSTVFFCTTSASYYIHHNEWCVLTLSLYSLPIDFPCHVCVHTPNTLALH